MYKKLKPLLFTLAILFTVSISVNAAESYVQQKFIDSNTWTSITTANKSSYGNLVEVKITAMFKADGTASNYSRLNVRLGSTGQQSPKQVVYKGYWHSFSLGSNYVYTGTAINFYGMGYDPALDCRITGYFNAH